MAMGHLPTRRHRLQRAQPMHPHLDENLQGAAAENLKVLRVHSGAGSNGYPSSTRFGRIDIHNAKFSQYRLSTKRPRWDYLAAYPPRPPSA